MKAYLKRVQATILIVSAALSITAQEWVNISHTKTYSSVNFVDANTGYVCGEEGTIIQTNDGGESWKLLNSGTSLPLYDINFLNSTTGFAAGGVNESGILLKTTDNGSTWTVNFTTEFNHPVIVFFRDFNTFYLLCAEGRDGPVTYFGKIFKSENSADSWTQVGYLGTTYETMNDICFKDADTGFIVSWTVMEKTVDGGDTWESTYNIGGASIHFADADTGYRIAQTGAILKSVDGGSIWDMILDTSGLWINDVAYINDKPKYILSGRNIITPNADYSAYITHDSSITGYFSGVFFVNDSTGFVSGSNGTILKTTDSGTNWNKKSYNLDDQFNGIFVCDTSPFYIAGDQGMILQVSNNGKQWMKQNSNTDNDLFSVFFPDHQTGFCVGDSATILKTSDGGSNWIAQNTEVQNKLNSEFFIDSETGYIAGDSGTILATLNGGDTWTGQMSTTNANLKGIYFINADNGYAVGDSGIILNTLDGGDTWSRQNSGSDQRLNSVFFISNNTGYAVGDSGLILHTTNTGVTWATQPCETLSDLLSVYFTSADTGYVAGRDGKLFFTADAGSSWTRIMTNTAMDLNSIRFNHSNRGFVVGEKATILKYAEPGSGESIGTPKTLKDEFIIYPNPTQDRVHIVKRNTSSQPVKIDIFNYQACLLRSMVLRPGQNECSIDLTTYETGIYLIRLSDGINCSTYKCIRQ